MKLLIENWRKFLTEGDVLRIGASNRNKEIVDVVIDRLDWTPARKEHGAETYAATIINLRKKGYTSQMIADKIDQMEMDAIYSDLGMIENQKSPELYGNCGMLAVALLEEGIKRNKQVEVVFLHNAQDPLEDEDYDLYHVAMYYNGKYYDDRGETTEKEMSSLVPLGLTTPQNEEPRHGRDYNLDSYIVDDMQGLDYIYKIVESLTGWSKTCDEYRQRSIKFWDGIENETIT